jgi:hypothetical protein
MVVLWSGEEIGEQGKGADAATGSGSAAGRLSAVEDEDDDDDEEDEEVDDDDDDDDDAPLPKGTLAGPVSLTGTGTKASADVQRMRRTRDT